MLPGFQDDVDAKPLLVATFLDSSADDVPLYTPVLNFTQLKTALEATLLEHNESNAVMDLVLFEQVHKILRQRPVTKLHAFECQLNAVGKCCRQSKLPSLIVHVIACLVCI